MRYAVEALVEADRHDAADLLERVMHARELVLEGRRDPEALRIRENAPGWGRQVELLKFAAGFLREFRRKEQAAAVDDLAERIRNHHDGDREGRDARGHERRATRERDEPRRANAERHEAAMRRIERLERGLTELAEAVKALRRELRSARRERD